MSTNASAEREMIDAPKPPEKLDLGNLASVLAGGHLTEAHLLQLPDLLRGHSSLVLPLISIVRATQVSLANLLQDVHEEPRRTSILGEHERTTKALKFLEDLRPKS